MRIISRRTISANRLPSLFLCSPSTVGSTWYCTLVVSCWKIARKNFVQYKYVTRPSVRGNLRRVQEKIMPRIRDEFLESVIYLYPSRRAAQKGEQIGGSGFLVSVKRTETSGWLYAVTRPCD